MVRTVVIVFSIVVIIGFSMYYLAYFYSFRNYGKGGNWKPLSEYQFETNKAETEKRMNAIVLADSSIMKFAPKDYQFSKGGWTTLLMKGNSFKDCTVYIFRFKGDSLSWSTNPKSQILLFGISGERIDITPSTLSQNDDILVKSKISLFESNFIKYIKKHD